MRNFDFDAMLLTDIEAAKFPSGPEAAIAREAQRNKALWGVANWLGKQAEGPSTSLWVASGYLTAALSRAGIPRPD
jgi:hypothetical protein